MKTRCLIIDDEPLAIKVIESHIRKIEGLEIVGTCSNAVEALNALLHQQVDLMFLDVEMPEISGIDLLKSLKNNLSIIFITAHRDFALEAYELDAIDYLLKPISFERFFKAISRYYQLKGSRELTLRGSGGPASLDEQYIYVRADRKVVKIFVKDIRFIESLKDYVKIHLDNELIITKEKISTLEEKLPQEQFIRSHRSFLVAARSIKSFTAETIDVDQHEIPIGRTYKNAVLSFLGFSE